jgi:hypothetical protein
MLTLRPNVFMLELNLRYCTCHVECICRDWKSCFCCNQMNLSRRKTIKTDMRREEYCRATAAASTIAANWVLYKKFY